MHPTLARGQSKVARSLHNCDLAVKHGVQGHDPDEKHFLRSQSESGRCMMYIVTVQLLSRCRRHGEFCSNTCSDMNRLRSACAMTTRIAHLIVSTFVGTEFGYLCPSPYPYTEMHFPSDDFSISVMCSPSYFRPRTTF